MTARVSTKPTPIRRRRIPVAEQDNVIPHVGKWAAEPLYIDVVAKALHREIGTLRRWENDGRLPKHLLPKRGIRRRRYWTRRQVFGEGGLVDWMKENDMRPGNQFADPANEHSHVENLRKPKFLTDAVIDKAGKLADEGKTRYEIAAKLLPEVRYETVNSVDKALMRAFKLRGWDLPPRYLTMRRLRRVLELRDEGRDMDYVSRWLFKRTEYTSVLAMELELERVFKLYGWEMPKDTVAKRKKRRSYKAKREKLLTPEEKAEIRALERRLKQIEALTKSK